MKSNPIAAMILAKKAPAAPMPDAEDAADGGSDEGLEAAAEDAMAAVKSGDAKAFMDALKHFVSMCAP